MNTVLGNMMLSDTLNIMKRAKEDLSDLDYVSYLDEVNKVCHLEADIIYKRTMKELGDMNNTESITLGEMDDKMYAEQDKNIDDKLSPNANYLPSTEGEITEDEYNELFQSDAKDQFNEVEEDIMKRSAEYNSGRPLDP